MLFLNSDGTINYEQKIHGGFLDQETKKWFKQFHPDLNSCWQTGSAQVVGKRALPRYLRSDNIRNPRMVACRVVALDSSEA